MRDPATGQAHTQHTTNLVPALLVGPRSNGYALTDGRLCDIAPTLLHFLGLPQPAAMTGHNLAHPGAATAKGSARPLAYPPVAPPGGADPAARRPTDGRPAALCLASLPPGTPPHLRRAPRKEKRLAE